MFAPAINFTHRIPLLSRPAKLQRPAAHRSEASERLCYGAEREYQLPRERASGLGTAFPGGRRLDDALCSARRVGEHFRALSNICGFNAIASRGYDGIHIAG